MYSTSSLTLPALLQQGISNPAGRRLRYKAYNRIDALAGLWAQFIPENQTLLQVPFLKSLENCPPKDMQFYYLVMEDEGQIIGLAYVQLFHINVEKSIQKKEEEEAQKSICFVKAIGKALRNWITRRADYDLLICGNLLLTGPFGFAFKPEIAPKEQIEILNATLESFQKQLNSQGQDTQLILIKDFPYDQSQNLKNASEQASYTEFKIQPCMEMEIRPEWHQFEDYLSAMSSKYRVRAKRAAKKGQALERRELSLAEIEAYQEQIDQLYRNVASNVDFNAFSLHPQHFVELKRQLQDEYRLFAYFLDGEMLAFYTGIRHENQLFAHFLGLNETLNHEYQIYLNILYDLVKLGIDWNLSHIDFARTALEIKSSVGAVAEDMYCYIKHRNSLSNKFVHFVVEYMNPKEDWQPRHPFKEEQA